MAEDLAPLIRPFQRVKDIYNEEVEQRGRGVGSAIRYLAAPLTAVSRGIFGEPVERAATAAGASAPVAKGAGFAAELLVPGLGITSTATKATRMASAMREPGVRLAAKLASPKGLAARGGTTADDLMSRGIRGGAAEGMAGNINLRNIAASDDVIGLIRENAKGIERRVQSHEETIDMAQQLGMTPAKLQALRRNGAWDAAELTAARDVMVTATNDAVEWSKKFRMQEEGAAEQLTAALERSRAIQGVVSGKVAEAGRALNALRIKVPTVDLSSGTLEEIAKRLSDPTATAEQVRAIVMQKPTTLEKVQEYWVNALLSGPQTHVANVIGNSLQATLAGAEKVGEVAASKLGAKAERQSFRSVPAYWRGLIESVPEAIKAAGREFKNESELATTSVEFAPKIGGTAGRVIRTPTRLLSAEDVFFKTIARRASVRADAANIAKGDQARYSELVQTPTPEMLKNAERLAERNTFTNELGRTGKGIQHLVGKAPALRFIVPFIRTPINIVKEAARRTPVALAMPSTWAAFKAGGASKQKALAQMSMGSGMSAYFANLASEGYLTGAEPVEAGKRELYYAAGNQPFSVKVGDQWVSYKRLEPLASILGSVAAATEIIKDHGEVDTKDVVMATIAGMTENVSNKTFMSGMQDLVQAIADPKRYGANFLNQKVASFVPAIAGQTARALDPIGRETMGEMGATLQSRIPGLKEELYPKRDILGDPVTTETAGPDIASPFVVRSAQQDELQSAMDEVREYGGVEKPDKYFGRGKDRIDLTAKQYDQYQVMTGASLKEQLLQIVRDPKFKRLEPEEKLKLMKSKAAAARKVARDVLKKGLQQEYRD
ncbi:MAG: hypothetical protein ACREYE_23560 [Gammaproteobacteria bacterium]